MVNVLKFGCLTDVRKAINDHELTNKVKFVTQTTTKDFGGDDWSYRATCAKRIMWANRSRSGISDCDGVPYVVLGRMVMECRYGVERHVTAKEKKKCSLADDHNYRHRYRQVQETRKLGCPAKIYIYEHCRFPTFAVDITGASVSLRNAQSKELKKVLDDSTTESEHLFVVVISDVSDHKHHYMGPLSEACLPVHDNMRRKLEELFRAGVRRVTEFRTLLDNYVKTDLFAGQSEPPLSDARFWLSNKFILGFVSRLSSQSRSRSSDESRALDMIENWRKDHSFDDSIQLNLCQSEEDEEDFTNVVFVHQSKWQKRMMQLYGSKVCLVDATYRTTSYDLPLLCLCVATNVGYCNVATMLLVDEKMESIAAGIQQVKLWNPHWHPTYFMSDFHEGQIQALESTFPDATVLLCKFHRLQAWNRHLAQHPDKRDIITMLKAVANSKTEAEYNMRVMSLMDSQEWASDDALQKWLSNKWIPHHRRWVRAFFNDIIHANITTTNGLERQHEDLKYNYLCNRSNGSLSDLLEIVIKKFVPDSEKNQLAPWPLGVRAYDLITLQPVSGKYLSINCLNSKQSLDVGDTVLDSSKRGTEYLFLYHKRMQECEDDDNASDMPTLFSNVISDGAGDSSTSIILQETTRKRRLRLNPIKKRKRSSWVYPARIKRTTRSNAMEERVEVDELVDHEVEINICSDSNNELPDLESYIPCSPPRPRKQQPTQQELFRQYSISYDNKVKPYQLTVLAPLHETACKMYDFVNEKCLDGRMPPANDILRWSNWHTDGYSGLAFGSPIFHVCSCIVLSIRISKPQSLLNTVIHEMAHGILHIRGIDALHGKEFQSVVSNMVKVLKTNITALQCLRSPPEAWKQDGYGTC